MIVAMSDERGDPIMPKSRQTARLAVFSRLLTIVKTPLAGKRRPSS